MSAHRKLSAAQIETIVDLYSRGVATQAELAREYGVTASAISWHLARHGLDSDDPGSVGNPLAALAAAVIPGEWVEEALCAQTDPELFFPEKGGSTRQAKEVCARCPVRPECLEYALENNERFGIWGMASERDRRKLQGPHEAPQRVDGAA